MLKDITLGQYFPGDTLAHRLDPRTKLLATVLYIIAIFLAKGPIAYGVLILTLIVSVRISKVGARALFCGLKPVLFIIAFTAVLNLFYTPGTVIAQFWIFHVTREGVITAIAMMLRISLLIMGTFLLTYTTSPIRLTDGLEDLLGPLKKVGVPVHELAMMMSIALRFIPTLIEETDKIMSAPAARTLRAAICSSAPRRSFRCSCRCSSAHSAARTSWRRRWSAAATTAVRGARSSMSCATRRGTI